MDQPRIHYVESPANSHVKALIKLRQNQTKQQMKQFVAEGEHFCQLANANQQLQALWISADTYARLRWSVNPKVKIYIIAPHLLQKLSNLVHGATMLGVCEKAPAKNFESDNLLILDKLQDPGNLGTLMRSAAAFNFKTIIASFDSVSFYNPKVLQATQGLIFELNLIHQDLASLLPTLKDRSYFVIGTFLHAKFPLKLKQDKSAKRLAVLIGNEGQGLSSKWLQFLDYNFVIRLKPPVESLNAAVAGSIIMYELSKWLKES